MTIAFAICLLLAATVDPPDVVRPVAEIADREESDRKAVLESLDRDIQQWAGDPDMRVRLPPMYATRGWFLLQQGEPEKALADFDAALALDPRLPYARSGRAECFRRMGDAARADAEMQQIGGPGGQPWGSSFFESIDGSPFGSETVPPAGAFIIVFVAWLIAVISNVSVGWGQKVEARGSFARLAWVAVCLGLIEILPVAVWAVLASTRSGARDQFPMAVGMTLLSLLFTVAYLRPPVRLRGTKEKLPRVDDHAFLSRVVELAERMNVPVPVVRLWPSLSGSQQALAFAGTIQAPQLVVTDGILGRLATAERDAIVAHELAHISNGSLWPLAAVLPMSCAAATAASVFVPMWIVWPFGFAVFVGLKRLVSRPYEFDCDRRAARAIGFRETTAALAKIHAVHPIRNSGFLSLLVYATATHPSREIRLAALRDAAPESDRPTLELSDSRIRWQRRAALAALMIWVATVCGSLAAALSNPQHSWPAYPLWFVALTPFWLLILAQRKQTSLVRKRMGRSALWRVIPPVVIGVLSGMGLAFRPQIVRYLAGPDESGNPAPHPFLLLVLFWVLASIFVVWLVWTRKRRKLRHEVAVALQVHDFRRAVELGRKSPKVVARDHILRYNVALARAICDDRPAALAMLECLWQDNPRFHLTAFLLCQFLLDGDQPERALGIAQGIVERLPRDPATHLLEARVRRRLGQLDEAQAACDRGLALEPGDAIGCGVAAAIALDRGDVTRAQELIGQGLLASPGEAYLLVIDAEIALQAQSLETARAVVKQALSVVRTNPLVFLQSDISRLEHKLAQREGSAPIFETVAPVT